MKSLEFRLPIYDFGRGIIGNISDLEIGKPNFCKLSNNFVFSPKRGTRIRGGSRALSSATLADQPHTLGKYLSTAGANKTFVGADTGIFEVSAGAYTAQSLPFSFGGGRLRMEQLNDVLFVSEDQGGLKPLCYIGTSWEKVELQVPSGPTTAAPTVGGAVDAGVHYYRVRNRYTNGSSLATACTPTNQTTAGVNLTVPLGSLPSSAPGGRADWLGWTIERTKANDPLGAAGTYYIVATGVTGSYNDTASDDSLWDAVTNGWYTGPQAFDGLKPYRGRLFGWQGTFLYPSWEIGSDGYLGIMNFDPLNALRVGSDDGDSIRTMVSQGARAIVFKRRSMHLLEGSDLDSFNVVDIPDAGGCSGPRAATTINGTTVIFFNSNGLFVMKGNTPVPFGWTEIGHYIENVNPARIENVVLSNIGNRYFLMTYSAGLSLYNNEALLYDFNTSTWAHFTEFNAEDVLYQEDGSFAGATLLTADGLDRSSVFQCYSSIDGLNDRRASDNSGGSAVPFLIQPPSLDFGAPSRWKDLNRVELTLEGTATDYSITIISDTGEAFSDTVRARGTGKDWCEDVATYPDDLEWDVGDWGADDQVAGTPSGISVGMLGKRFSVTITGLASETTGLRGLEFDGRFRPERRKV